MSNADLPENIQEFIFRYVNSITALDTLVLLYSNHQKIQEGLTAETLSKQMRTNPSYAETILQDFCQKGLLKSVFKDNQKLYFFNAEDDFLNKQVADLVQILNEKRSRVMNLIYVSPAEKLKSFTDAFDMKKQDKK